LGTEQRVLEDPVKSADRIGQVWELEALNFEHKSTMNSVIYLVLDPGEIIEIDIYDPNTSLYIIHHRCFNLLEGEIGYMYEYVNEPLETTNIGIKRLG
jgi:hypothetical protein